MNADDITVVTEKNLKWDFPDRVFYSPRVVDYHAPSFLDSAHNFIKAAFIGLRAVRQGKPKLVLSTGPAIAVPVCLVAKLIGITVVHIESWSRISTISNTTKFIRMLRIADVVVYQYKNSVLAGQRKCEYWGHL